MNLAPYAKAITALVLATLTALGGYLTNDTSLGDITSGQWVFVTIAAVTALGVVFAVPNKPAPPA